MGYEASLADIDYTIKNFEDRGIKLQFSGYQATLLTFARLFVDLMLSHRQKPFLPAQINNSIEKLGKQFKNANVDVSTRCENNRLLHLLPNHFHASLI